MSDAAAKRRAQQTLRNLILSLLASIGVMLLLLLAVPRDDSNRIQHVDYLSVAKQAAAASNAPVLAPQIPKGWWSNSARWQTAKSDGVATWYVGFVGPKGQYIGLTQGFTANPTWLALQTKTSIQNGTFSVDGRIWKVFQNPIPAENVKTRDYLVETSVNSDEILLYGTASVSEFKQFAKAVNNQIVKVYK